VHAVLLYGPEGAGKRRLAERLCAFWLCPQATDRGPCGSCSVCASFAAERCVDHLVIEPQPPSYWIRLQAIQASPRDASGGDSVVPLTTFVRTRPLMAAHKTVLILDAHRLMPEAANSLLKPLEEPEPHTKLVLTTSSPSSVPDTIRARCLCLACALPGQDELHELVPNLTAAEALFSDGAPELALRIRERQPAYDELLALLDDLPRRPSGGALAAAEQLKQWADALAEGGSGGSRGAMTELLRCMALWIRHRVPNGPQWWQEIVEAHRKVRGNANPALVLDALLTSLFLRWSDRVEWELTGTHGA
jgi:hypothetical protein